MSTHPDYTSLVKQLYSGKTFLVLARCGVFLRSLFLPSFLTRTHPWRTTHTHNLARPPGGDSGHERGSGCSRRALFLCGVKSAACIVFAVVVVGTRRGVFLSAPFFFCVQRAKGQVSFLAYV